jgi:hypothetical protein
LTRLVQCITHRTPSIDKRGTDLIAEATPELRHVGYRDVCIDMRQLSSPKRKWPAGIIPRRASCC